MRHCLALIALALVVLAGCGETIHSSGWTDTASATATDSTDPDTGECQWTSADRPEELPSLGCEADHAALAGSPSAAALPANRNVMFLIERTKDNAIHFFDTRRWRHFTFAKEKLEGFLDMTTFNAEMYYQPGRRLYLGTLAHYLGPKVFAVEISPIDKASPEMIAEIYDVVKESLAFSADLRYHPTSNALEMESRLPEGVPIITTAELYEGATFQGLNLGRTIGRVRLTTLDALSTEYLSRLDIVVLDKVPNDVPAVAGVVTAEFQTPLSHVNLLAQSRGTPNMALLGATTEPDFVDNEGQWVELEVRADGYSVRPATQEEAEAFWEERRPPTGQTPDLDLSQTALVDLEEVDATWVAKVGGKAANFGEMEKIEPAIPLPVGFAIPCSAYVAFMESTGLQAAVEAMLDDPQFRTDGVHRMAALEDLREQIAAAAVDPDLLEDIQTKIDERIGPISVRFRSSSNAEDLVGFNGAGLYDSATYKPADAVKTLPHALQQVWASLWTFAAFEERDWARVDHLQTAMGVLVHRSFPDDEEAANGVAITDNPFDPPPTGQAAYYINVQTGATSITNPEPGVTPESFLYYKPPAGKGEMTYLSYSSLTGGEPVLTFEEIVELNKSLKAIHGHFQPIYAGAGPYAMDIEFKLLLPDRSLIIKQARPYGF